MLTGTNLSKSYPSGKALNSVSIHIPPGQICGLLGRNGAGKTTLFKILCGLVKPDHGQVIINSKRSKPVGGIIERPGLYNYLNAYDNIKIFAGIQGAPTDKQAIEQTLLKVGLPLDRKDPVRNFSLGMKQRLGIAIALINDPECLVLDEPFSGLDPIGVASLIALIRKLAEEENIAILLSSHMMGEISKCCHFLYVIEKGEIVNSGTTNELINAHITSFSITASNLRRSETLKNYEVEMGTNDARVVCDARDIPSLLTALLSEGIQVTACTPVLTLEQLIQKAHS
ncbi:ABC-2 type transport system ATP-binding protein/bacitracin transport system ATP-binding protein [Pedobacter westerhofensis]|uniref:ABC-2 type transport system ATP-binding protein/bacitracin transport system ATP-binding protein n=1 Tax=Pedobacter westerhofensis TaxID=425512 RepID=A0A521FRT3_9SPHI|nr:ABC transporter ATP-binding protein [Pedobacter westerhofensis]SMO98220.1 ABC-2 type transport system ATP-binding protein/bacitracin transport system ATP-binding protein [Pedobacter westerhofensis]